MTKEQRDELCLIGDAIVDTVRKSGPTGASGGVLYAALMTHGCSLAQFEAIMSALVHIGKIRKSGQCYFSG